MKFIRPALLLVFYCLFVAQVFAQNNITLVWGTINKENARSIILYEVIEGKRSEYANTRLDSENRFAFALPSVKEGFYYLSDQYKNNFTRIYLRNGEKLELQIHENGYDVVSGSTENKTLHDWFVSSYEITGPAKNWMKDSSTYVTYFPTLNAFVKKLPGIRSKLQTKNKSFNELLKLAIDVDVEYAAMHFLLVPNSEHPKKEQYPDFYKSIIKPGKYPTAGLLRLGDGVALLRTYATFNLLMNAVESKPENRLLANAALFGNDTLKGAFIANSLTFKTYEELEKNITPVKQYLVTDSMQASYFRALKALAGFKKGSPSYNFSFEDIEGKNVSMEQLKGKVVLIDVWATWCGPCRVEIPHLKKLEEAFSGQDIAFVSISTDAIKDKEKWRNMVTKDQMGGIQLYAGSNNELSKYYDIKSIPRFMLFDKNGKIITTDSPRPSDPELKELLEQLVKTN